MTPSSSPATACRICGGKSSRPLFEKNRFTIVKCRDCGVVYVANAPDARELQAIYVEDYYRGTGASIGTVDYIKDKVFFDTIGREKAGYVQRFAGTTPRTLLDIGCGMGCFLGAMKAAGWTVEGIEVSAYAADYVSRELGIPVACGTVEQFPADREKSFDVVTLWDVLEHVPDPGALLKQCRRFLKPGGTLFLSTTHIDTPFFTLFGKHARIVIPPSHLYYFSVPVLKRLLHSSHLELIDSCTEPLFVNGDRLWRRCEKMWPPLQRLRLSERWPWLQRGFHFNPRDSLRLAARDRASTHGQPRTPLEYNDGKHTQSDLRCL